jgi:D-alanyl-D-alanine carboxypeptidase
MKRLILRWLIILLVISVGIIIALQKSNSKSFDNLNQELRSIITEFAEKNKSVRSCVLAVTKGDNTFFWSGAAGIASQANHLPMTEKTPIYLASVTKLFTATAIMRLYELGLISLDDPMSKYLPETLIHGINVFKGIDYSDKITIKELLSHTSGIPDYYEERPKGGKNLFEILLENQERSWSPDAEIARARDDLRPNFEPGTDASYSDTNFQLLGKIIEVITGKPLHTVYEEYFFLPLGLKNTWMTGNSADQSALSVPVADVFYKNINIARMRSNGSYWADGGLVSTVGDMIVFLKALNEGLIVSKETLGLMKHWHKLQQFPLQYGLGMMYIKLPWYLDVMMKLPPIYGHSGTTGSFLYYSEDMDLYIAGSINQTETGLLPQPIILMNDVMKAIRDKIKAE